MNNLLLHKKRYDIDSIFRLLVTLLSLAGILLLSHFLKDVLIPFFIAFLMAYLINPFVNLIQTKVHNRIAAMCLALISIVLILLLSFAIIAPIIGVQMIETGRVISTVLYENDMPQKVKEIIPATVWVEIRESIVSTDIQQVLKNGDVLSMIQPALQKILPGVTGIFSGAASVLGGILTASIIAMYLVFLLIDFEKAKKEWIELIPPAMRKGILGFLEDFYMAMDRYFRGQAIIAFGTGVLFAVGFSIIGLPLAILLGLAIGMLNMVPYLALIGLVPATIFGIVQAIDTGTSIPMYLGLVYLIFIVVQLIQDGILTPKIMGKSTGLSPAFILLSLSVWGKLLGMLGLIIAIPMTCLCLASYKRVIKK